MRFQRVVNRIYGLVRIINYGMRQQSSKLTNQDSEQADIVDFLGSQGQQ
jgi:hypothetical protein